MEFPVDIRHPAWVTGIATVVSYSLILAVLTAAVFLIPYLVFVFLL
jgi:hypothetical protein